VQSLDGRCANGTDVAHSGEQFKIGFASIRSREPRFLTAFRHKKTGWSFRSQPVFVKLSAKRLTFAVASQAAMATALAVEFRAVKAEAFTVRPFAALALVERTAQEVHVLEADRRAVFVINHALLFDLFVRVSGESRNRVQSEQSRKSE
jgi:hypothetical protein